MTYKTGNANADIAANTIVVGGETPAADTAFDIQSTNGGILIPRVTEATRDAFASAPPKLVYDVTDMEYVVSKSVVTPFQGAAWSGDGSKLYMTSVTGTQTVTQYNLSTPYKLSTMVDSGLTLDTSPLVSPIRGIWAKPDGTALFVAGVHSGNTVVRKWSMVEGQLSSAVDLANQFQVSPTIIRPDGVYMNPAGTELYVTENYPLQKITQITLSTPWLPSSGSVTGSLDTSVGNVVDYPLNLHIVPDGTRAIVSGIRDSDGEGLVVHYTLSTPELISSGTHDTTTTLTAPPSYDPGGIHFHPNGKRIFFHDNGDNDMLEYTT